MEFLIVGGISSVLLLYKYLLNNEKKTLECFKENIHVVDSTISCNLSSDYEKKIFELIRENRENKITDIVNKLETPDYKNYQYYTIENVGKSKIQYVDLNR